MIFTMQLYDPSKIEPKWQKKWESSKLYRARENSKKKKFFGLIEFPYPSGDGLHVGHIRSNTAMDIIGRKRRMEGCEVLYPIGWDAFGLPTENYAIKTGIQPSVVTKKNTDIFRRQLKALGFSFDWSREINTTDPKYYRWTQWLFLQFLKKGLAYKKKMAINWCPKDLIGLANEEVIDGKCERCGTPVEKKEKEQWMLAITKYADRLDKDLDTVDYLERIKTQQRNWIGRSEGAEIDFNLIFKKNPADNEHRGPDGKPAHISVFTTRPDTIFGATYLVLSPEHLWVTLATDDSHDVLENKGDVRAYVEQVKRKTEIERTADDREKTGVELRGVKAINPATGQEIPMFIADYVLAHYGTGAIMAVPAHDERDGQFAEKYNLPVKEVVIPHIIDHANSPRADKKTVERNAVQAIIRNPRDGKILCLAWKTQPWTTFVVGGIEGNEDPVEAARREVKEETGYKNLKLVSILGGKVKSEFFASHKDENRIAYFTAIHFELENDDRDPVSDDEQAKHEVVWKDLKDIRADTMRVGELDLWLERLAGKGHTYTGDGVLIDSGRFGSRPSQEVKKEITEFVGGRMVATYKLRDWIFSRQRYWGEPIPVIHCDRCGIVPVPEKDLPVKLPAVKNYKPTETGESPLATISKWVNTKCPQCKGKATRETDTMPNWAGSSWYYLRYTDPKNSKAFAAPDKLKYWTPVDWYNGGMEHTTLHLLYSRFWHKFLYDEGLVPTIEPYAKRTSHGLILAEGGEKMSKSRGNVINPDGIIKTFGADALRVYEMFMGPFDQPIAWDTNGIVGTRRFIEKVWRLHEKVDKESSVQDDITKSIHKAIKKVSDDIEAMAFNTAVSTLMITVNEMEKVPSVSREQYGTLLKLLAPFAPHVAEELWSKLGNRQSIHLEAWPEFDPKLVIDTEATIVLQIGGKTRGSFKAPANTAKEDLENAARNLPEAVRWLAGRKVIKVVVVPGRLVNFVISEGS
jgi:leucyl-tRNA synthetase